MLEENFYVVQFDKLNNLCLECISYHRMQQEDALGLVKFNQLHEFNKIQKARIKKEQEVDERAALAGKTATGGAADEQTKEIEYASIFDGETDPEYRFIYKDLKRLKKEDLKWDADLERADQLLRQAHQLTRQEKDILDPLADADFLLEDDDGLVTAHMQKQKSDGEDLEPELEELDDEKEAEEAAKASFFAKQKEVEEKAKGANAAASSSSSSSRNDPGKLNAPWQPIQVEKILREPKQTAQKTTTTPPESLLPSHRPIAPAIDPHAAVARKPKEGGQAAVPEGDELNRGDGEEYDSLFRSNGQSRPGAAFFLPKILSTPGVPYKQKQEILRKEEAKILERLEASGGVSFAETSRPLSDFYDHTSKTHNLDLAGRSIDEALKIPCGIEVIPRERSFEHRDDVWVLTPEEQAKASIFTLCLDKRRESLLAETPARPPAKFRSLI
eukprot:CAMPEP_0179007636 /NCGR_PEP_ID=MMETSP0795-20121207/15270_1 /TAXON_ID=88552 /ORGANISM="Amoebophrya sp., Strain Ameob2" /LENGTH=443 /DNA_ID=CAMNT_0020702631 /DNA_START=911 /DNA_END=2243 /DNA_ORIENTATION=+